MRKGMILLAAAALAVCACQQPKLVILHTNDTHSHFEPLRGGEDSGAGGSIERAAFVDSIRTAYGRDRVLLLHAGDFSQGSPYFSELGGVLEPRVINDMQYDCVTLGNHEFDNDIEALTERIKMLRPETRVVCANLDLRAGRVRQAVRRHPTGRTEDRYHRPGVRHLHERDQDGLRAPATA